MNERTVPRLVKWPFIIGDAILVAAAVAMLLSATRPLGVLQMALIALCVALGAWFSITPFLREYATEVKRAETKMLADTLAQIQKLETVGSQISQATAQWQSVQEQSVRTVGTAKEITDRIVGEAKAFAEFLQQANDSEKANLRLEAEKSRRAEGEWLQVVTRLLDHIYAVNQAAARSGQRTLIEQLGQFQNACRDTARRVGLVPFVAKVGEPFDEKAHQLMDAADPTPSNPLVAETIATGFTFQGQLLRRAVVLVRARDGEGLDLATGESLRVDGELAQRPA